MSRINHVSAIRILMETSLLYLLVLSFAIAQEPVTEDESADGPKPAKLFDLGDTLHVTIKAPWKDLDRNERNRNPYPATIEYTDDSEMPSRCRSRSSGAASSARKSATFRR